MEPSDLSYGALIESRVPSILPVLSIFFLRNINILCQYSLTGKYDSLNEFSLKSRFASRTWSEGSMKFDFGPLFLLRAFNLSRLRPSPVGRDME